MATSSTSRRNGEEKRVPTSHYHERNRTFSSTTTSHYKNKLAQIGIQKDLREILERKKLEKEHEQNNPTPHGNNHTPHGNKPNDQASRKVRFVEEKIPLRRSHSFTSGTFKNYEDNNDERSEVVREKSPPKKFNRSFKGKKKEFIDLQNPTNIKVELQTDSGQRKYTLDENVVLATVKCNTKNCRNILNHTENKEKSVPSQATLSEKSKAKPRKGSYKNGDRNNLSNKKNREPAVEPPVEKQDNSSNVGE